MPYQGNQGQSTQLGEGMPQQSQGLLQKVLGSFKDDKGLFQGGQYGRMFGRLQDALGIQPKGLQSLGSLMGGPPAGGRQWGNSHMGMNPYMRQMRDQSMLDAQQQQRMPTPPPINYGMDNPYQNLNPNLNLAPSPWENPNMINALKGNQQGQGGNSMMDWYNKGQYPQQG